MKPLTPAPPASAVTPVLYGRRIAVCVFAQTPGLARLMELLRVEEVGATALSGDAAPAITGQTMLREHERHGAAAFLALIRHQASEAIALRLAHELAAGHRLLVIDLGSAAQETRILPTILAAGALSVQIHDLA